MSVARTLRLLRETNHLVSGREFSDNARADAFSAGEEVQLRRLVYQAFDLRTGPYLVDAVEAIVDWYERTLPDRLERALETHRDTGAEG